MVLGIIAVVVTIVLVIAQKYLSSRRNGLMGVIVPVLSVALMAGIYFVNGFPLSWKTLLPCVFILVLEILIWIDQRIARRRAELNKMKAKDI